MEKVRPNDMMIHEAFYVSILMKGEKTERDTDSDTDSDEDSDSD